MNPKIVAALAALGVLVVGGFVYARSAATEPEQAPPGPEPLRPGETVLLLGDSIGVGTAQHLANALGDAYPLAAVPQVGWTAKKVRAAYEADPVLVGDVVVVSLGSNDAALADPSREADDVAAIVSIARERGARRVVWVVAPNYAIDPPAPATHAKQQTFLALVRAQDVELLTPSDEVTARIGADRIHLPPRGYEALGQQIAAYLKAA